jgi:intracellular sulfur oxidation DsrE/DsrF family protein
MNRKTLLALMVPVSLLAAGCATAPMQGSGPVGADKVVYHVNDTDDQAVGALRNIGNHLEVNPQAKIVVVTHARGVDFLFNDAKDKNGNPYNIKVEELKGKGVQFDVCQITLRNRKLDKSKFLPEATFVPSGVAEITPLQQREGYAYLRP